MQGRVVHSGESEFDTLASVYFFEQSIVFWSQHVNSVTVDERKVAIC